MYNYIYIYIHIFVYKYLVSTETLLGFFGPCTDVGPSCKTWKKVDVKREQPMHGVKTTLAHGLGKC